jgi:hypothetical protein
MNKEHISFKDVSVNERILNTVFLLAIGVGYLVALSNLYLTHQGRDDKEGLSIQDVVVYYHGSQAQTRLGNAITGIMEPKLKVKSDKEVILKWIKAGADEAGYNEKIAPILNKDCVGCHSADASPLPDLSNYAGVSEVAHAGGATVPNLIRISHIHLFGITFILFFVGKLFILCKLNVYVKRVALIMPFLAMFIDVSSWFITRHIPDFAYVVVISGALMGISIAMQLLITVYQMWFFSNKETVEETAVEKVVNYNRRKTDTQRVFSYETNHNVNYNRRKTDTQAVFSYDDGR